jgi:sigma54-dependent transcription regulator
MKKDHKPTRTTAKPTQAKTRTKEATEKVARTAPLLNGSTGDHRSRIAHRAYELYLQGGRKDGRALEDWLEAERQLGQAARTSQ